MSSNRRQHYPRALDFAEGLTMPITASADTHVGYGVKGWGKTYMGMRFAECVLDAGGQIIAIDITGVWWGLTSSADGKRPGYPLYVFGGNKADLPLVPESGELLARTLVESRASAVLDLSLVRKGAQHRFCGDFLEALYLIKAEAAHRDYVCTLMMDEGNRLAPQQPDKDQTRVLGAAEDIILQGRSRGLGMMTLTQRPAVLNKNISTQAGGLILGRIVSPQDQKAVADWLNIHATPEARDAILGKPLATMPQGEAFYISTSSGDEPARIKIKPRTTFDSSYTPRPGQRAHVARVRAKLDVDALSAEITQLAARVEADKPSTLKRRVVELEAQLAKAQAKPAAPSRVTKARRVEVPALGKREQDKLEKVLVALTERNKLTKQLADSLENFRWVLATDQQKADGFSEVLTSSLKRIADAGNGDEAFIVKYAPGDLKPLTLRDGRRGGDLPALDGLARDRLGNARTASSPPIPPERVRAAQIQADPDGTLNKPMRAVLTVLAQRGPLSRPRAFFFAGYRDGGRQNRAVADLIKLGYVRNTEAGLEITAQGRDVLGPVEALKTASELRGELLGDASTMSRAAKAFLRVLVGAYPVKMKRGEVLAAAGYGDGGRQQRALAWLVKSGYATVPVKNHLRAADTLFDEHEQRAEVN